MFEGFADAKATFFKKLAKHNDREWFGEHKEEYEEGWNGPMKTVLEEVRDKIDASFPHCELDEPKTFRIYRDVRFSKDKAPYKTHVGGLIPTRRTGRKITDVPMALYFHVGAEESFAAAGHYMMEPESLARFRKATADDKRGRELTGLLARLAKKGYAARAHEVLKRPPKGYDPEHPRAELLKWKGCIVRMPDLPNGILAKRDLVPWLVAASRATAPLVTWLALA